MNFIKARKLNEFFDGDLTELGIITQGGMYNGVVRALERLGLADVWGATRVPIYCLNVTYPLVDDEIVKFCAGKKAILIVEEGQPEHIEQAICTILRRRDINTKVFGKDVLPMAGEYTADVMFKGVRDFMTSNAPGALSDQARAPNEPNIHDDPRVKALTGAVPPRPPGFCTGCPERPIFAAMKLVEKELGKHHIAGDIGCHLFSSLPPFNIGAHTMGYGLGPASAAAFNVKADKKSIAFIGDGGFWHNGLNSSIGNAVYNKHDGVIVVVDNFYSSATGGQDLLSSRVDSTSRSTNNQITKAIEGVGATWVRQIDRTYDVAKMRDTLKEALTTKSPGPKVIVASSECMLNKQRRVKPLFNKSVKERRAHGARALRRRRGRLHRRSRLHASLRLPVAVDQAHRRSAQGRSGRRGRQYLRRLRQLRRGGGSRRIVPVLLSRRHHL